MKLLKIAVVLGTVSLIGCAGMVPTPQVIRFTGQGGELAVEKVGCVIERGRYTDLSGKGNRFPFYKFIAVTNSGETVAQWFASCPAVVPNGTARCTISGPKKAYFECGNYDQFKISR